MTNRQDRPTAGPRRAGAGNRRVARRAPVERAEPAEAPPRMPLPERVARAQPVDGPEPLVVGKVEGLRDTAARRDRARLAARAPASTGALRVAAAPGREPEVAHA